MNYEEKKKIYEKAKRIIASDLKWNEKFDLIFSEEISPETFQHPIPFIH